MKYYIVLAIAIVLNAAANILMKIGMDRVGGLEITSISDIWEKFFQNYVVWMAIVCFVIALLSYSYVLSFIQLSIAYPILTSVAFVLVTLASLLYLSEKLSLLQLGGIGMIMLGVWLVAK